MSVYAGPYLNTENNHYYYLLEPTTWSDAESQAQSLGGHLATINDPLENTWVTDTLLPFVEDDLWIGLSDAESEGTFQWSSGAAVGFTNWGAGEPNNAGNEDFTYLAGSDNPFFDPGEWNDLNAFFTRPGLVEIDEGFQSGTAGRDVLMGSLLDDHIIAGGGDDDVVGSRGDDLLIGGAGDDNMSGGRGDDTLHGFRGDDDLSGGRGADTLTGEEGDDNITGDRGDDRLEGGDGDDDLSGGRDNDLLLDGDGIDFLSGGEGWDVFLMANDGEMDIIEDFSGANGDGDLLDLYEFGPGADVTYEAGFLSVDGVVEVLILGDFNLDTDLYA
ncbi:MAG: hypothetical protein H6905_08750 [Hyphomicrobiales bacterium]|nr:hypothetical protein [Hyphomicrobiales bacterium]